MDETTNTEVVPVTEEKPLDPRIEKMINETITKAVYRITAKKTEPAHTETKPVPEVGQLSKDAELNQLRKEFEQLKLEREKEVQLRHQATKKSRIVESLVQNEITDPGIQKLIIKYLDENIVVDGEDVLYRSGEEVQPLDAGIKHFIESEIGKALRPAKASSVKATTTKTQSAPVLTPPTGLTSLQMEMWYRKQGVKF